MGCDVYLAGMLTGRRKVPSVLSGGWKCSEGVVQRVKISGGEMSIGENLSGGIVQNKCLRNPWGDVEMQNYKSVYATYRQTDTQRDRQSY